MHSSSFHRDARARHPQLVGSLTQNRPPVTSHGRRFGISRAPQGPSCQWNESPHAQELLALGLSIVNPCCEIVSAKSICAPLR